MKREHVLPAAAWVGGFYLLWLHYGTRANPPEPLAYEDFRTGLSFEHVRELLAYEQQQAKDAGGYMFVSRGTVLGRWRELKQQQYQRYLDAWEEAQEERTAADELELAEDTERRAGDLF